jgi:hypothetical protein
MRKRIHIRIAEITIALEWEDRNLQCKLHRSYQSFYGNGTSDIVLRLRRGIQDVPLGKKVFDCAPVWNLYRGNGKWVVTLFTDEGAPYGERVMVLHPSLRRGELCVRKPADGPPFAIQPFSGPTAELLMVQYLSRGHGTLLHACGIMLGGKGILFVGHSGAGKSTMARLWRHGTNVPILSDDRIIVRKKEGVFWMYGTPWHGEGEFASPSGCPVDTIYFLKHAGENKMAKTHEIEAASRLLTCSFPPFWDGKGLRFTLDFLSELSKGVPCRELGFFPDKGVIPFIQSRD